MIAARFMRTRPWSREGIRADHRGSCVDGDRPDPAFAAVGQPFEALRPAARTGAPACPRRAARAGAAARAPAAWPSGARVCRVGGAHRGRGHSRKESTPSLRHTRGVIGNQPRLTSTSVIATTRIRVSMYCGAEVVRLPHPSAPEPWLAMSRRRVHADERVGLDRRAARTAASILGILASSASSGRAARSCCLCMAGSRSEASLRR